MKTGIAAIDKHDVPRVLLRRGQVLLVDAVAQSRGGSLVEQSQDVQAGNSGGVQEGLSLRLRVVRRHGDDAVVDGSLQGNLADVLELGEQHRRDLLGSEDVLLAQVLNVNANVAVAGLRGPVGQVLHLLLCLGVVEFPAQQPLETRNRVLHVRHHLVLGGYAEDTVLSAEGDA